MKKLTIGKASNNDIVISNDPTVSRKHAHLLIDGDTSIIDLNSTNGTYVNGVKINGSQLLKPLDVVRLGNSLLDWASYNEGRTIIDAKLPRIEEIHPIINLPMKRSLDTMVYWGKFLAILGYVCVVIMILVCIAFLAEAIDSRYYYHYYSRYYYRYYYSSHVFVTGLGFLLLIMLYYFPTSYLYKFSDHTRKYLVSGKPDELQKGLSNLSFLFKFIGILTIVILSIYILAILLNS